jgi:hypothetical protein
MNLTNKPMDLIDNIKALIVTITLASSIVSCSTNSRKETKQNKSAAVQKQDSIDQFWNWFALNQANLHNFQSDPDKTLTQVLDEARKINKGLAVEFEPPKNNIVNVTISADGDRNLFPVVQKIVEKAPRIEGWSFVAFRQRIPREKLKEISLKVQGVELSPNKMKFLPVVSGDSLDVIIYGNNITDQNFNQVAYGGLMLVDNILGEYDCVKKIRSYDFQNMPKKRAGLKDLRPLVDLAKYVDSFHNANP